LHLDNFQVISLLHALCLFSFTKQVKAYVEKGKKLHEYLNNYSGLPVKAGTRFKHSQQYWSPLIE